MEIKYRKLLSTDIDKYHQIRLKCLYENPENFGSTYEEEIKKDSFRFDEYIIKSDENNFLMGAFENEKCIGICGFMRESGKRKMHRGKLIQVYVLEAYQGLGIGKQIISKTIDEAFEKLAVEQIILGVITNNKQATKLYEKLGFKEYAILKDYLKLEDKYLDQRMMIKYRAT